MGRMVANKGNGDCISTADPLTCTPMPLDVVLIPAPPGPPIPTPFVNTAKLADAVQTIDEVKVNSKPVVIRRSEIPRSSGAPNNAIKGIISPPPANNRCNFITSSATVFAGGYPIVRHRDITAQNAGNCPGAVKLSEAFTLTANGIILDPNLTPDQIEQVVLALERLAETPRGHELLTQMQNTTEMRGHTTTITVTNAGNSIGYTNSADRFLVPPAGGAAGPPALGPGTDSTIYFNPTQTYAGTPLERPPEVGLGHELVHAYHAARGTQPPGARPPGPTAERELQATGLEEYANDRYTDNTFRDERGLPNRTGYGGNNFSYNPNPANRAPFGYRTGANGEHFIYNSR